MLPFEPTRRELWNHALRAWTVQLRREYDWLNREHLGGALRPVVLEIHPHLTRQLGRWSRNDRTISISFQHVLEGPWLEVIDTLRHEMAHQYVDEVLKQSNAEPHGQIWRRACKVLGARPSRSRNRVLSPAIPPNDVDGKLRKIRKLLALADNNGYQHEVESALRRARELMLRYNIDLGEVDDADRDIEVRWLGEPKIRVEGHYYRIASLLVDHFFVRAIWVATFLPDRLRPASQLEICGEHANVAMAEYVFDSLLQHLRSLWNRYRQEKRVKGIRARNAYWQGLLAGFRAQLEASKVHAEEQGLVWVGDPILDAFYRARHPRVGSKRITVQRDSEIRQDGVAAGKSLRISRPIEAAGTGVKGLLLR